MGKVLVPYCTMFCTGKKLVKWESHKWENRLNGKGIGAHYAMFCTGKKSVKWELAK